MGWRERASWDYKGVKMEYLTEEQKDIKLQEIAVRLGTTVTSLCEGKTKDQVIQQYESGSLGILNE